MGRKYHHRKDHDIMSTNKTYSIRLDKELVAKVKASKLNFRKFIEAMIRHKLEIDKCPCCGRIIEDKKK